jgi:hypothetical protein
MNPSPFAFSIEPTTRVAISSLLMAILPLRAGLSKSSQVFGTSAAGIAFLL